MFSRTNIFLIFCFQFEFLCLCSENRDYVSRDLYNGFNDIETLNKTLNELLKKIHRATNNVSKYFVLLIFV